MTSMNKNLLVRAHISTICENSLDAKMRKRAKAAEEILHIAEPIFDQAELNKLGLLLGDLILGPIYQARYKTQLDSLSQEFPFLGKQQIRRRKSRETRFSEDDDG